MPWGSATREMRPPGTTRFPDYTDSLWVPRGSLNEYVCGKDLRVPDSRWVSQVLQAAGRTSRSWKRQRPGRISDRDGIWSTPTERCQWLSCGRVNDLLS